MKILVTGAAGQLGHDVLNELYSRNIDAVGTDVAPVYSGADDGSPVCTMPYYPLDITNDEDVSRLMNEIRPDALIHCAAWTAVDAAEDEENRDKVFLINEHGTANLAGECAKIGCRMMYISTDYVFDGTGSRPWEPDDKNYAPLNVYGASKLAGEKAVTAALSEYFIVRIAWVFGKSGKNFIRTMLELGKKLDQLRIVNDQMGTPTYTKDLAALLCDMIVTDRYGFYHATNSELKEPGAAPAGFISWYDLAVETFRQAAAMGHPEYLPENLKVTGVTTEEYGLSKAARPFNSTLSKDKLEKMGFKPLPDWQDALSRYLKDTL